MPSSDNNPYNAPDADLDAPIPPNQSMQQLPYISIWTALGLTIITLGMYYLYWLFTRSKIINQVHDNKIPSILIQAVLGLMTLNLGLAFMSGASPEDMSLTMYSNIVNVIYSLVNLYWVFVVRSRIHEMAHAQKESEFWLHGALTFFFQVLYMQYKINQYHETHHSEGNLAG